MKRRMACISALVLAISMAACGTGGITAFAEAENNAEVSSIASASTVQGSITVDGNLNDWAAVPKQSSSDNKISWWKAVKDSSGNLYVCFTGEASTQWYGDYNWEYLGVNQNTSDWTKKGFQIANTQSTAGGTLAIKNTANGNTAGPYYVELMVPASYFVSSDAQISFAGSSIALKDVPAIDGNAVPDSDAEENKTYHGIKIDGSFDDWNAVTKYDAKDPNSAHPNNLSKAAMVFDGDYVYIYVEEGPGGSAAGAGSHSNGNFEIKTDLGNRVILHFHDDGTVTSDSVSGIESKHVGSQWEVAVPAGQLPYYKKTISFGLYAADESDPDRPFVEDVANLDGSKGNAKDFDGNISYDGNYDDWKDYPHTLIEYATAGTQKEVPDGEEAIYAKDGKVYGHVFTEMPEHLNENSVAFTQAVSIRLNHDNNKTFWPRFVTVDESGVINWNPDLNDGQTREYYILDSQGWNESGGAKTLSDLKSGKYGNNVYGKMTVSLDSSKRHECEYYLDDEALAKKFNMDASDIKYVEQQFGRIGQQWVGTSGSSTGPFLGVGLCMGVTALALFRKKIFPFGI